MKWKKRGMVFDFYNSPFRDRFVGFAQSPQVLVFDTFVRIYFSTRLRSENGKFVSVVQFINMDRDFRRISGYSNGDVIPPSKKGTFDEHGIFPINVVRHENRILAYTTGWTRRVSVSCDTGIGLAESFDNGETFVRYHDGPVLSSSLNEPYLVCDGFVRNFGGLWHMWYIYGTEWRIYTTGGQPERTYKIGHAVSSDGIQWKKEGAPVIAENYPEECQALPTVLYREGKYHMYFCHRHSFDFRKNSSHSYRLGYAWSENLSEWERDDTAAGIDVASEPDGWDAEMMCYPHVCAVGDRMFLLYNGNEFGRNGFGVAELVD
jgi:hypothetical protein